jgi:hypothetical protein
MTIHHLVRLPLLLAAFGLSAQAAPLTFDFKDPKGVNNVQFSLDAPLESITGTGTGISGSVTFDPAPPAASLEQGLQPRRRGRGALPASQAP